MNNKELLQEIIQFVSEETNTPIKKIHGKSRLLHDLGLDGMDGIELLEVYSEKFNVDISEMDFGDYFGPEAGCNPIVYLIYLLFFRDKLKSSPLTIEDLARGVETKKLV